MSASAASNTSPPPQPPPSAWAPFRYPAFTALWGAMLVSNIGTWMHEVGAGWLMTELSSSPLHVALVQTATSLPIFIFALPAGALADTSDRRRLLLRVQALMALLAMLFAGLVSLQWATPTLLLVFTLLLGICTAFSAPAWQAIVTQLVPKPALPAAVALNSVGINVSRAIGPTLAGLAIVGLGLAAPFVFNALSFIGVLIALYRWRPTPVAGSQLPPERTLAAIIAGLRYARASRTLQATLLRAIAFFLFASAFWALLPLIAKQQLQGSAHLYGMMLGAVGLGAVVAALLMPRLKQVFDPNARVAAGSVLIAAAMLVTALLPDPLLALLCCLLFGAGWISVLTTLNVSAQVALPDWVRARGLSLYLMVFFGSLSLGSALWGQLASYVSLSTTLATAGVALCLAIPLVWRARLHDSHDQDLAPSMHWPMPLLNTADAHARGPVMTTIEYHVVAAHRQTFLQQMQALGEARKRLGAYAWGVLEDAEVPGRFIEYFMEVSWLDHLRHHERVSAADRQVQDAIVALHSGDQPPKVTHLLGPQMD